MTTNALVRSWFLPSALCFLVAATTAEARKPDMSLFNAVYKDVNPKIKTCQVCHFAADGSGPRNLYGRDYHKAGNNRAALLAIEQKDSDKDGVSNIEEIKTGHFPGDLGDKPTEAELQAVRAAIAPATAPKEQPQPQQKETKPKPKPKLVIGAPVKLTPDQPLVVYDGTLTQSDVGVVADAWGGGKSEEVDDVHLGARKHSLKLTIKGLYEGARMDFGHPINFGGELKHAYLALVVQFPRKKAVTGGAGAGMPGAGTPGAGMPGIGMPGMGMPGMGGPGGAGGMEPGMMGPGMGGEGGMMGPGMVGPGMGGEGGMMGPGMVGPGMGGMAPGMPGGPGAAGAPGGMAEPGAMGGPAGMGEPGAMGEPGMGEGGEMPGVGMPGAGTPPGETGPPGAGGAGAPGGEAVADPKDSAIQHLRIVLLYDHGMRVVPRYPLHREVFDPQTKWAYLDIPLAKAVSTPDVSGNLRRLAILGDGEGDIHVGQVLFALDPDPLTAVIKAGTGAEKELTVKVGETVDFYLETKKDRYGLIRYAWDFDASDGIQEDYVSLDPTETVPVKKDKPGTYIITVTISDRDGVKKTTTQTFTLKVAPLKPAGAVIKEAN